MMGLLSLGGISFGIVGDGGGGGNSSSVSLYLTGVTQIFSNNTSFAALKTDGSVITWGISSQGGDSSSISTHLTKVIQIFQPILPLLP